MASNFTIIIVFVIGVFSIGVATDWLSVFTTETARRVSVERAPRILPPTLLEDQSGNVFSLSDFKNKLVLVQFIYTQCPTICTQLGNTFEYLSDSLAGGVLGKRIVLVSISFDWTNDNQIKRAEYADAYGADTSTWKIARTVNPEQTKLLLDAFSVTAIPDEEGGYVHNGGIHFIGRNGRLSKIYDDADPKELMTEMERVLWKQAI